MGTIERVTTPSVPEPTRLYSQAIRANGFLFLAGQGPVNATGELVGSGDVVAQTRQVFANIRAFADAAGASMDDVVRMTMYLVNVGDAPVVRPVRTEFFTAPDYPALTVVGNIALAIEGWLVEIEATIAL